MREQSVAGLLSPKKRPVKEAKLELGNKAKKKTVGIVRS